MSTLRPDEPVVTFRTGDGEQRRLRSWRLHELPPQVLPILDRFHRFVDEARASPVQVLAGEARLAEPSSSPKAHLKFELSLRNAGVEPIVIRTQ